MAAKKHKRARRRSSDFADWFKLQFGTSYNSAKHAAAQRELESLEARARRIRNFVEDMDQAWIQWNAARLAWSAAKLSRAKLRAAIRPKRRRR